MNPFRLKSSYDEKLAKIVTRISRVPVSDGPIEELIEYLPEVDLEADIAVIKAVVRPLVAVPDSRTRMLVNKLIWLVAKQSGPEPFRGIQCEWMYQNFDVTDKYARAIFRDYFHLNEAEADFYSRIRWEDGSRALSAFLYLIRHSQNEFAFDIKKANFSTAAELGELYQILEIVAQRLQLGPHSQESTRLARLALANDSPFALIYKDAFEVVKHFKSHALISLKYKILLKFYGFVNDDVYNESKYFTKENFEDLGRAPKANAGYKGNLLEGPSLNFDLLDFQDIHKFCAISHRLSDKKTAFLRCVQNDTDIIEISDKLDFGDDFIVENFEVLEPAIKHSIMQFEIKNVELKNDRILLIRRLFPLVSGPSRIVLARILKENLNETDFGNEEIEEVFGSSVWVFPESYFFSKRFNCSCVPLLRRYPNRVSEMLELYPNTRLEEIIPMIQDVSVLKQIILPLGKKECLDLYRLIGSKLSEEWTSYQAALHTFYYKLKENVDISAVDFGLVFEYFFEQQFLVFLAKQKRHRAGLLKESLALLCKIDVKHSIYLTGYNLDTTKEFYYNLEAPEINRAVAVLNSVYGGLKRSQEEEVFYLITQIIIFEKVEDNNFGAIRDYFASVEAGCSYEETLRRKIPLGKNEFILNRLIGQMNNEDEVVLPEVICLNKNKGLDVALRQGSVNYMRLKKANFTFLSLAGLERAVKLLLEESETEESRYLPMLDEFFPVCGKPDLIQLIGTDKLILSPALRQKRIQVYEPLLSKIATEISSSFTNNYSFAKLESSSDDCAVLELILSIILPFKSVFWLLLVRGLHFTGNLYVPLFIEDMLVKMMKGAIDSSILEKIESPEKYLEYCIPEEANLFAFVLPGLFRRTGVARAVSVEALVREAAEKKVDGARLQFLKSADSCSIRMSYPFDSVSYQATISVPANFPAAMPKIEFDYRAAKCPKLYLKLNELLRRSCKFQEVFIQWKTNLDNRFEGHKECFICYYILDPRHRAFADYLCKNCGNNFHERCIFEWVRTSGNSQCPLCRVDMGVWDL